MRKSIVLFCALALLALPGCASKYGEQRTQVAYYPACYRPISDLRANEYNVGKSTGIGAALGAASGALIGFLATGRWEGAVMGGAMGGVGGSMVGNAYGTQQQQREDNIRLNNYLQQLDGDVSNLDVTAAAARTSLQCYDREFQALLNAIRAKSITREAAQKRFAEIQSGREEAIAILGDVASHGDTLERAYEQAFVSEQQQMQSPQAVTRSSPGSRERTRAVSTARQRKQEVARKTSAVREERDRAQNATRTQTQEINDALAQFSELRA